MKLFDQLEKFNPIHARTLDYQGETLTFHIREMSADETESLFMNVATGKQANEKNKGLRNRILAMCVVDEDGTRADAKLFGKLPNEIANKLQALAFEVNGIGQDAKKETEEETKND